MNVLTVMEVVTRPVLMSSAAFTVVVFLASLWSQMPLHAEV